MKYNVAVVGALGAVGQEMTKTLLQRNFPAKSIKLLDIPENAGKTCVVDNHEFIVQAAEEGAFTDIDIALFSAGGDASLALSPIAAREGAIVIDNSSAFRMDPEVPLVIPEVNPEALDNHKGIIANPNCSTIQMLVALKPIHEEFKIKRIIVSTYQAVSGSGKKAIDELSTQAKDFAEGKEIKHSVYPHQILFNAIPHIDVFMDNGYTKEEMKMVNETKKILDKNIEVSPTAVRVPVFRSHSESINLTLEKAVDLEKAIDLLNKFEGIKIIDDNKDFEYPLALDVEGTDDVYVGRIRKDFSLESGLNLWVVADNLRKGAALNAVQIAETLIKRNLL